MSAAADTFRPVRGPNARRRRSPLRRWLSRHERFVLGVSGLVLFLAAWQVGANAGLVDQTFFSKPTGIIAAGMAQVGTSKFWVDVQASVVEFLIGYFGAVVLAIPLGLLIGWNRRLGYMADPWLNVFVALPRVALLPLIVLWLGLGIESKMVVVFLGAFWSIIIPTVQGVRTVDRRFVDVATTFGASRRRLFTSVVAPSTVPFITTGLRLGSARALIGVVLAEIYAQTIGLGVMIDRAADNLRGDISIFGILIFTMTGLLMTQGLRRLENYFDRWRPKMEEDAA